MVLATFHSNLGTRFASLYIVVLVGGNYRPVPRVEPGLGFAWVKDFILRRPRWNTRKLKMAFNEADVYHNIGIPLSIFGSDGLIWIGTKSGCFTVKSAYHLDQSHWLYHDFQSMKSIRRSIIKIPLSICQPPSLWIVFGGLATCVFSRTSLLTSTRSSNAWKLLSLEHTEAITTFSSVPKLLACERPSFYSWNPWLQNCSNYSSSQAARDYHFGTITLEGDCQEVMRFLLGEGDSISWVARHLLLNRLALLRGAND
ncbi:hypothetical protein TorRG33x02_301430 [Trema orientale]|uniref:Uncharacterized protein n=1 Tax=Trema orientale TaxID=63057 RepID=A0A2P5C184_TREOI|nr:hypothetical protein TorRG33x02_301430 [Trema orientale]